MRKVNKTIQLAGLSLLLVSGIAHATAEVCGNDVDDDGNGLTDEGCYPSLTTGVCESPLSCGDTGMVSWTTGSLHYDLPPDLAPAVPYGPGIGFRRFYTPMYSPGSAGPASVNHMPLGPGWQHTYMTWIDSFTDAGSVKRVVLHTSQGRDVYYTYSNTVSNVDYYTPQAGDHVLSLKYDHSGGTHYYYVQLLTGETLKYNDSGQIIEIWDTLPTPNKVLITWDSTTAGNVSTVTDASGTRRLSFTYTDNLLTEVDYQTYASGNWTVAHVSATFTYDNHVTRDGTSGWFVPANATEWGYLLEGTGISTPSHLWECQETSGNPADSIGSTALTFHNNGGAAYHQTISGWTRKALELTSGSTSYWSASTCNPATTSCTGLALVGLPSIPTTTAEVMQLGNSSGFIMGTEHTGIPIGNKWLAQWDNTHVASSSAGTSAPIAPWIASSDPGGSTVFGRIATLTLTPSYASATSAANVAFGGETSGADPMELLYAAAWTGVGLSTTDATTVRDRIENGPGILTTVKIGGSTAQQNYYTSSGYLSNINDTDGNQIVGFAYSSTGQVVRSTSARGSVGFEYSSSRTGCTGDTVLYYNQGSNTSSCSVDSDCGTGYLCGGKTGTGSTGECYLAGRCMTTSTANDEAVVTNVSAIGGGGTCTGACLDVEQYVWSNATGLVNAIGQQDGSGNYTSMAYNSNGLPTQVGYADNDDDPTNGGTDRTAYYFYDSTFPGRLSEIRRASDVSSSASSCSATSTTGCERTLYGYGSDNQLQTVEQDGYTLASDGSVTTFANVITYTHDSLGRITEIDGGVSGIKTTFDYYGSGDSDANRQNFLEDSKTYTDATHYLEPQITEYDYWGHPTSLEDPNGNYTCDSYDSGRGFLSSRRIAMDGEGCGSSGSDDITTSWARDSALRLISVTRPDTGEVQYSYSTLGRLTTVYRGDFGDGTGDYQVYTNYDGLVTEVDSYTEAGSLTASQIYAFYDSRKLSEVINPVDTTKFVGLNYDVAGHLDEVDGEGGLSKTVYHYDGLAGSDGRVTSEDRYYGSNYDTWDLLYSWLGDQSQYEDGDSKITGSLHDDAGRLVRLASVDQANPTISVYDAASRLTTKVEDLGGTGQETHTFSFDDLSRPLNDDYQGSCSVSGSGVAHAEIQRTYDALPTGVSCPVTGGCKNLSGRLAYVDTILMCGSAYASSDGSLDQVTYLSYDPAGRVIEEYITDDTGRTADNKFTYNADGSLTSAEMPSASVIRWNYDSASNDSDKDLVTSVAYDSPGSNVDVTLLESIEYYPFGPLSSYLQENTHSSLKIVTTFQRNAAYRPTYVKQTSGNTTMFQTALTEDARGRVTSRVYTNAATGVTNSYFIYDEQDRVLCETTDSVVSCPTSGSGSDVKNSHDLNPPFTHAGDWKRVLRPIAGSTGGFINDFNSSGSGYGSNHQVTDVDQSDGSPAFGHTTLAYDERGNRSYDDNATGSDDRRDFTYDGRRNLVNVRGQYMVSSVWHYYDVASAFDAKNRRVLKSFYDETTTKTSTWFFYYDASDRLTEVKYTPDTGTSTTYSTFQLVWLGQRLVAYLQTDTTSGGSTLSRRYVGTDETGRPIDMWSWPSSGDAARVWAINPSAWGMDTVVTGAGTFQPILFAGQYNDVETAALENDGATIHRPGLVLDGGRTYDAFVGGYLQVDPSAAEMWSSYVYLPDCGEAGCTGGDGGGGEGDPTECSAQCWAWCEIDDPLDLCNCGPCNTNGSGQEGGPSVYDPPQCSLGHDNTLYSEAGCSTCQGKCKTNHPQPACKTNTTACRTAQAEWEEAFCDCYYHQCGIICEPCCQDVQNTLCADTPDVIAKVLTCPLPRTPPGNGGGNRHPQ